MFFGGRRLLTVFVENTTMAAAKKIDVQAQIFTAGDMSGSIQSTPVPLVAHRHLAVQAVWTGVPVGNLQLQVTVDGITWTDQGSPVAAGGGAGDAVFSETNAPWLQARLAYVFTSGTGVLNAFSITKE